MKETIMQELQIIYRTVSSVPVTNDNIDVMAEVRARLRKVYAEVEKLELAPKTEQTE